MTEDDETKRREAERVVDRDYRYQSAVAMGNDHRHDQWASIREFHKPDLTLWWIFGGVVMVLLLSFGGAVF